MSSRGTSRARATWRRASPAPPAASVSPSPPPGPGATNLVTPIADAWMDSTPLVCVTGQVRSHLIGTDAFQECDITGITIPIVKHSWLVQDVEELPHAIKAAFHVASTGRCGPVLVDIPRDIQEAAIDFSYPDEIDLPGWRPAATVNTKQVRAAAQAIADAQRPVLYVGGGTINAEACEELRALAELWQLPVVTTLMAKSSFPETHDLHFGWPGMHGAKWSNWAMNKCDVLVAVGARFDDRVTGKLSAFAPGATVVHLDVDAAEIGKLRRADIPVVGPLKQILAELASAFEALQEQGVRSQTKPWLAQLAAWREEFPLRYGDDGDMLKPQRVLETLQAQTSGRDDMIWTTGVGQHQMWAMQYLALRPPAQLHHLRRPRHDGLRAPGRGRREGRPSGRDRRLHRRRRLLPDDLAGARDLGHRGSADRRRDREQRLPRHGPAVAGHVLRGALLAGSPRRRTRPTTSSSPRRTAPSACASETEDELQATLAEALACGRTAVVDCRVDPAEHCFPMIPAGAAALDLVEYGERRSVPVP